jgi:hypothetical protein
VDEHVDTPFVSPGTRFAAAAAKATTRPSLLMPGGVVKPCAGLPALSTLTRSIAPVSRSFTYTWRSEAGSGTRFEASEGTRRRGRRR